MLHKNLIRRLDLITLKLFVAVYEEGTLTRAAAREAIAVSAASKRLMELEEVLGIGLFLRNAKGMLLTAAGETMLHHARRMLSDLEKMGLPEDLHAFVATHELVKVDLEERPSNGVVQGLVDGVADIGICSEDTDTQGLHSAPYRRDELVVVMRDDHPLAGHQQVAFEDTLGSDYIGLHAASSINMRTQNAARAHGRPLRVRIHVPGFDAMCRMVQADMGIGVLPRKAFDLLGPSLGLRAVGLSDEWARRTLILVVRDTAALSPVSQLLFDHLQSHGG